MAINNRTEAVSQVDALIVPTVTNAIHRDLLNNNVLNSVLFRKDIILTGPAPVANAVTADFSNNEVVLLTTTADLAISFTGLENGDVRYIVLTKNATNAIAFVGASDVTTQTTYLDSVLTSVLYEVFNKDSTVYVRAVTNTLLSASVAEFFPALAYKYISPSTFNSITTETAYSVTPEANFSVSSDKVYKQFSGYEGSADFQNNVQFAVILDNNSLVGIINNQLICTLPVALHSTTIRWITGIISIGTSGASTVVPIRINTDGTMTVRKAYTYAIGDIIQIHETLRY